MLATILALAAAATTAPAAEVGKTVPIDWTVNIAESDLPKGVDVPVDASPAMIERLSDHATCRSGCEKVGLRFGQDHDVIRFTSGADGHVTASYVAGIDVTPQFEGVLLVGEAGDPRTSANAIRFPLDGTRRWVVRDARADDGSAVRRLTVVWAEGPRG